MLKTIEKKRNSGDIYEIYKKQGYKCNISGCYVYGLLNLTVDHIVPKSVAKLYGWTRAAYEAKENKQLLCPVHHIQKDKDNNKRIENIKHRQQIFSEIKELRNELTN